MRTYLSDILQFSIRQSQKYMLRTDDLFSYNAKLILCKKIINISHNTGSCILNGKYREIRAAFINSTHGIPESFHMKGIDIFPEKSAHSSLGIRSLRSLVDHSGTVGFQFFHADKRKPSLTSVGG